MSNTNAIRAGRAYVELFADNSKLIAGLRAAENHLKSFGKNLRNLGLKIMAAAAVVWGPLIASVKTFSGLGDQMAKMSRRTGVSVESLSELAYAASISGTDIETLESNLKRMQKSIAGVADQAEGTTGKLDKLGLAAEDIINLSPEDQFKLIAQRISDIADPTLKAAAAMSVFGRSGTSLLPLLEKGAAGIEALQVEARKLGLTMSSEDAKAAEEFHDSITRLSKSIKMLIFHIGATLGKTLKGTVEKVTGIVATISRWVRENRGLIISIAKITGVVMATGAALVVLGTIISGLGSIIGGIRIVTKIVTAAFRNIASVLTFILSPLGLVISSLALLGVWFLKVSGYGGKAIDWLAGKFQTLRDEAVAAFGGIADALMAGDITLAARILWLTLKMEWEKGTTFLLGIWLRFKDAILKVIYGAFYGIQAAWEIAVHGVTVAMIECVAGLKKAWAGFTAWHARSVETTASWIAKKWMWLKSQFDESIDLNFATNYIEQESNRRFSEIADEQKQSVAEAENQRTTQCEGTRTEHENNLAQIGQEYEDQSQKLQAAHEQRMSQAELELAQARKQWQDAIAEAKQKRSSAQAGEGQEPLANKFQGLWDEIQKRTISVTGTFNAMELSGLGVGNPLNRTAVAAEETARNTRKLVDASKYGNLTFA